MTSASFPNSSVTVYAGTAAGDVAPLRSVSGGGTGLFAPRGLAATEAAGGASGFAILVPEPGGAGAGVASALALALAAARSRRGRRAILPEPGIPAGHG
ncbi:MAG: hypothetical protein M5U32_16460 [Myxococcota bacterium]|nr:hypothetical protein [Myxococcota bacterium]